MVFGNLNNLTVFIFIVLLILGGFFIFSIYKKENIRINMIILFFSFFFLIINIFVIKGGLNSDKKIIKGGKIVFVLDVSKSMNAIDIESDNIISSRFEISKEIINSYISKYIENNYGLIIFAGEALETLPFTNDIGVFKTVLYGVNNSNVSKYGTNLNSVFNSLHNYFIPEEGGGLAVIFTDGGDEDINISSELIESLSEKGVNILIVGIGSEKGAKINIGTDFFGRAIYKTYNGDTVITKLNNKVLKKISSKFDIGYIEIDNIDEISKIYTFITKNINQVNLKKNINYRVDFTRLFAFISFSLFIIYLFLINLSGRKK